MSPLIWLAHATLVARRMFPDVFLEDLNKVLIASQVIDYIARDGVRTQRSSLIKNLPSSGCPRPD